MNSRAALFLVGTLVCAPSAAAAPDFLTRRFHPPAVEERPVTGVAERLVDGKLNLTLQDFLELALRNAADIQITRLDVYTAADAITAAKAPTDPALTAGFTALRNVSPQFNQINGATTLSSLSQNSAINFQQLLPTGQTVSSNFTATRSSSNSQFLSFNPALFGNLGFALTQPLLQDRTNLRYRAGLEIARTQLRIAADVSRTRIADSIAQAAVLYWEAIRLRDNIVVRQQSLDLAAKSYERDQRALELGALAKLDIYQSETQLAQRKLDLIQAQYAYKSALDGLRRAIGADQTAAVRSAEIVLQDNAVAAPPDSALLPFEEALKRALDARPELTAAKSRLEVDDLNARIARESLLPRLDLSFQGGASGLGGNSVPGANLLPGQVFAAHEGGLGDALGQVFRFHYPFYGLGVQFTPRLRNSAAAASLSDSLVNRVRDRYQQRSAEQQVYQDVRQAINSLELAKASIQAASLARDLAAKNVEAEQQKYELGSITAFEVLDSQNRLALAESALLGSYIQLQEAFITYQRATWTILDRFGMVLEMPKKPN